MKRSTAALGWASAAALTLLASRPSAQTAPGVLSERCYLREYSAAHLVAHPGQTVRALAVQVVRMADTPDVLEHSIAAQFIDADAVFAHTGLVHHGWYGLECDGGRYRAKPYRQGILVTVDPDYPPTLGDCGADSDEAPARTISGRGEDDRFYLPEIDCGTLPAKWR